MSREVFAWYASIFFGMYFTGIGIPPCPEEAGILAAAGLTALHEEMRWWISWPLTSAGILCADLTLYAVGRLWGYRLYDSRWGRWVLSPERRQRLEKKFHDHGLKILLAARFFPPLRTGLFMIAGTIHFPFFRFLAADAVFAVIGVGVLFFSGAGLIQIVQHWGHQVLWVALPVVLAYGLYRYYRFLRQRELKGLPEPPVSVLEVPLPPEPARPEAPESTGLPR